MDRKVELLRRVPLFSTLEGRSLEAVATLAREVAAPAGTVLMREGEPAESFYLIVSGTVHVERAGTTVRSMSDGGFVGEIALAERGARTATVTCATDCQLLMLGSFEFERVTATFPDVRARITATIRRRPHAGETSGGAGPAD
ncbi:MAG TPA: cyclic nucleotide-binding domain-containing protein [Candidatus Sulfomarinibacteraceae bacterium]|nr:cyclic nucleotide-binding domain-containing protein [Candidatus Sulfomarinibacteraceae bacterium]